MGTKMGLIALLIATALLFLIVWNLLIATLFGVCIDTRAIIIALISVIVVRRLYGKPMS